LPRGWSRNGWLALSGPLAAALDGGCAGVREAERALIVGRVSRRITDQAGMVQRRESL
jgi:hypothetical protein